MTGKPDEVESLTSGLEGGRRKRGRKTTSPAAYPTTTSRSARNCSCGASTPASARSASAEAICQAVQSLQQFQEVETDRIRRFQHLELKDVQAESIMLRAYEKDVVSHRLLPRVIEEWRTPSFEEFAPRTLWSLFNAFTTVLGERRKTDPQRFAALTIRLQDLLGAEAGLPAEPQTTTAA